MATHDYILANASGAAFRTDLNNALAAIVSNNSNSSSPATTYAYQWWADTSAGVLKIRNSANNAWIELLQLDGTLTLEDGSASAPALAFRDDLNTGIFSSAADTFNIATGGSLRLIINSSGFCGIGTASPQRILHSSGGSSDNCILATSAAGNAFIGFADNGTTNQTGLSVRIGSSGDSFVFQTGGTNTRMFIKSDGNVGIGSTNPQYKLHVIAGGVDQTARFENAKTGNNEINYIAIGLASGSTGIALFGHTGHSTAASQAAWFGVGGDDVAGGVGVKAFKGGIIQMNGVLNVQNGNSPTVQASVSTSGGFGAFFETTSNTASNGIPVIINRHVDNGIMIEFKVSNTVVATIHRNSLNQMVYGGQSDYRLKENNVAISDSIAKIKSLKPYEFNFKNLPNKKILGFFAHELQEVVPQAVTGTKDEMYEHDDTKPKYQNVDNSHVVPLLVAAVQELITKVETLEAA
tara:strand:+ start:1242 stop:2636 length:1395 start_codon:yes stop_codon:yes gene_type:complete